MKTEVFVPFTEKGDMQALGVTLDEWDTDEYEPVAICVKDTTNYNIIAIGAEAIAKGDYIIASIGSHPTDWHQVHKKGSIRVEACQPRIQ